MAGLARAMQEAPATKRSLRVIFLIVPSIKSLRAQLKSSLPRNLDTTCAGVSQTLRRNLCRE
jgi:hypothetical protein